MADTIRILGQQVGDDYTTMAAAKADVPADIVATGGNWRIQIRADANYDKLGSIPDSNTDLSHRLIFEAFAGDEVDGSGVGAGMEQVNVSDIIGQTNVARSTHTLFKGIKIITSGTSRRTINISLATNLVFEDCFIKSADYWAVVGQNAAVVDVRFRNCIFADSARNITLGNAGSGSYYEFDGCSSVNSGLYGFGAIPSGSTLIIKNSFGFGSSTEDLDSNIPIQYPSDTNIDYLASEDATASATAFSTAFDSRTTADFVNYAGGDYSLASGSTLKGAGEGGADIGATLPAAAPATGVTADLAVTIPAPTFAVSAEATQPQPDASVAFTIDAPTFAVSAEATLPQPSASVDLTIAAPAFSASASATIPFPVSDVSITIPAPTFSVEAEATQPQPSADVDFTISAPTFSVDASASLPQPSASVDYTIAAPTFSIEASATEPNFTASVAFTVDAPTFSAEASASLPQPDADAGFTVSAPTFSVVAIAGGIAIIVDNETNINVRALSNNIDAPTLSNNIEV